MSRFRLLATLALLLPWAAHAKMYRCDKGGTVLFSDKPCAPDAQPYRPKEIQVIPSVKDAPDLAKEYDERMARQTRERDKDNEAWNKAHETQKKKDEAVRAAWVKGKPAAGMSQQQVRNLLGDPLVTSHNENRGVVREGWTYVMPDGSRTIVYFKDGIVSSTATKHKK